MNLLLITEQFPFGHGEQFISAELRILSKHFARISVVPFVFPQDLSISLEVPSNVIIRTDVTSKLEELRQKRRSMDILDIGAKLPFSLRMHALVDLPFCHPCTARDVIDEFAANAADLADCLETMVTGEDRVIVYSYWLRQGALAALLLKENGQCTYAVARAHGYDVYAHRHGAQRLPFQRMMLQGLDAVYSVSRAGELHMTNSHSALHKAIYTRYLGTESQEHLTQPSTDGVLRIVSCSSLKDHKRVPFIADALQALKRNVEWIHIGGDGEDLRVLQKRMEQLPSHIRASAPGKVVHAKVFEYYRTHPVDVFLNVSTSEGIPVSIMEAMSFSIPCVATDAGGNSEIISSSNGVLLQSDSVPADLTAVLESWNIQDAERRATALRTQQTTFDAFKNYTAFAEELISVASKNP